MATSEMGLQEPANSLRRRRSKLSVSNGAKRNSVEQRRTATSGRLRVRPVPIDHTDVKLYKCVQTGTEAVDEGHCTNVQGRLVHTQSAGAVGVQAVFVGRALAR